MLYITATIFSPLSTKQSNYDQTLTIEWKYANNLFQLATRKKGRKKKRQDQESIE